MNCSFETLAFMNADGWSYVGSNPLRNEFTFAKDVDGQAKYEVLTCDSEEEFEFYDNAEWPGDNDVEFYFPNQGVKRR